MRSRRARRLEDPAGVLGGKNSREKYVECGGREAILWVIFSEESLVGFDILRILCGRYAGCRLETAKCRIEMSCGCWRKEEE